MHTPDTVGSRDIIDALEEGLYVCDRDRRITYWSRAAERITGWSAAEVVGRQCFDNVLCHVDKDGHRLCGEEYCPLHRAMVTGTGSPGSLLVFARSRDGDRVPMQVSVSPIRDASGAVIGGVETFRDASAEVHDLERAKAIQQLALAHELPRDDRVAFRSLYVPHDIIGGDYYAIEPLDGASYGFMLADVTGHGIAAALYTMHLSQLWDRHHELLHEPARFAETVNGELTRAFKSDSSFATALCGVIDVDSRCVRWASAGGPPMLVLRGDGTHEVLDCPGFPLALLEDADYEETSVELADGDRVLLFSDGAFEVMDRSGHQLGVAGLVTMCLEHDDPRTGVRLDALEEALLKHSTCIRLPDDLTVIEMRMGQAPRT